MVCFLWVTVVPFPEQRRKTEARWHSIMVRSTILRCTQIQLWLPFPAEVCSIWPLTTVLCWISRQRGWVDFPEKLQKESLSLTEILWKTFLLPLEVPLLSTAATLHFRKNFLLPEIWSWRRLQVLTILSLPLIWLQAMTLHYFPAGKRLKELILFPCFLTRRKLLKSGYTRLRTAGSPQLNLLLIMFLTELLPTAKKEWSTTAAILSTTVFIPTKQAAKQPCIFMILP